MGMGAFLYVNGEAYDFYECREMVVIAPENQVMNLNYKVCYRAEPGYQEVIGCVYVASRSGASVCRTFGTHTEDEGSIGCFRFSITEDDVLVLICLENDTYYPDSTDDFENIKNEVLSENFSQVTYIDNQVEDEV